jgi:hypothetical protein
MDGKKLLMWKKWERPKDRSHKKIQAEAALLSRCLCRFHLFAAGFIAPGFATILLLLAILLSCVHLARRVTTAGTMMKDAAAGDGHGPKHEQGEKGNAFCFHLYSPYVPGEIFTQISGMAR